MSIGYYKVRSMYIMIVGVDEVSGNDTVGLSIMTMVILLFLFLCATNRKMAPRVAPFQIG